MKCLCVYKLIMYRTPSTPTSPTSTTSTAAHGSDSQKKADQTLEPEFVSVSI